MKKIIALLLALCLAVPLAACGDVKQTNRSLTIFVPHPELAKEIDVPLRRYRSNHPEIDVQLSPLPEGYPTFAWDKNSGEDQELYTQNFYKQIDQYNSQLNDFYAATRGEIAAGNGPDLILFWDGIFPDINKVIASGTFASLDELMEADPEFKRSDYNEVVMKAGQFRGKQYAFPLFYNFQCLFSTEKILSGDDTAVPRPGGVDVTKATDFNAMLQEAVRAAETNPSQRIFSSRRADEILFPYSGLDPIDYDSKALNLDTPEFRAVQDSFAALAASGQIGDQLEYVDNEFDAIQNGLIDVSIRGGLSAINLCAETNAKQLDPVVQPIRTVDGGIRGTVEFSAAIRANSANRQNAWDFMKVLLADEFQSTGYYDWSLPVKNLNINDRVANLRLRYQMFSSELVGLNETFYENYLKWVEEIDSVVYYSDFNDRITEYFEPYYKGESSYDECLRKAKSQLAIYASE